MENATKALLIAAAVLVAILIISFGLVIYNKSTTATDSADLTATQIQAQNEKFAKYEGENQRGSVVNALLETVLTNNTTATSEGAKVTVNGAVTLGTSDRSIGTKADTSVLYNIACTRGSSGVITTITITRVGTTPQ
ncbi:MAG: hypothetical protein V8R51_08075 [Clostridia bacterium]